MVQNQAGQKTTELQPISMYEWRAARREAERREESVNREILHRLHAN